MRIFYTINYFHEKLNQKVDKMVLLQHTINSNAIREKMFDEGVTSLFGLEQTKELS